MARALLQRAPGTVERAKGSGRKRVGRGAEAQLRSEVVAAPGARGMPDSLGWPLPWLPLVLEACGDH